MRFRNRVIALLASSALLLLAVAAGAQQAPPPPGGSVLGLEITAVDPASRTVTGVMHCTDPQRAGQQATFRVGASVEIGALDVGDRLGVAVDPSTNPPEIRQVGPLPCQLGPGPGPGPGAQPGPGPQPGGGPGSRPGADVPQLAGGFMSRVWKFVGEVDGYDDGTLSITLDKVLNLPRKWASQDDELVDEDAYVLIGGSTRVYDQRNRRVDDSKLAGAEQVRVHGKLLRPDKWRKDEDGSPTTTIRAKKVYILG